MLEALTEVHLRRLDTEDMLHRCGVPRRSAALRRVSRTPVGARGSCGSSLHCAVQVNCAGRSSPKEASMSEEEYIPSTGRLLYPVSICRPAG